MSVLLPKPVRRVRERTPLRRSPLRPRTAKLKRGKRPNPRSRSPLALAKEKADEVWRREVKRRAGGWCECCLFLWGRKREATDAMHIFRRGRYATRWHLDNGIAGCRSCHRTLGSAVPGKRTRMGEFVKELRGELFYEALEYLTQKVSKAEQVLAALKSGAAKEA